MQSSDCQRCRVPAASSAECRLPAVRSAGCQQCRVPVASSAECRLPAVQSAGCQRCRVPDIDLYVLMGFQTDPFKKMVLSQPFTHCIPYTAHTVHRTLRTLIASILGESGCFSIVQVHYIFCQFNLILIFPYLIKYHIIFGYYCILIR